VLTVALRRVLQNGKITMNEKTIAERRSKYEMIRDPVKCFVETAFEQDSLESSDFTTKDMTFQAYRLFCKENKIAAVSKEALGKKLSEFRWVDGQKERMTSNEKKRVWCWLGHKLT
jgi:hypothetical protein